MSRYQFPAQATTDASLLVSGTLADARLSSNVALENTVNTFTAKQSFSGVDHVGLCLQSLTTAQYNALTPSNGDLFRDSTTDRIDARLTRGTVELVDTAGGQTINGALTVGGTLATGGSIGIGNYFPSRHTQVAGAYDAVWMSTSNSGIIGETTSGFRAVNLSANAVRANGGGWQCQDTTRNCWIVATGYEASANGFAIFNAPATAGSASFSELFAVRTTGTNVTNLTASGTVTATGAGTHTFGTTNTVTMAAGTLTANNVTLNAAGILRVGPNHRIFDGNDGYAYFQAYGTNVLSWSTGVVLLETGRMAFRGVNNPAFIGSIRGSTTNREGISVLNAASTTVFAAVEAAVFDNPTGITTVGNSTFGVSVPGTLRVGGGTIVTNILSATATLNFSSVAVNSFADLTITVTGAALGDTVSVGVPNGSLLNDISFFGWVSAADTVTIRCSNVSSTTARDPASGTFRATVIKF